MAGISRVFTIVLIVCFCCRGAVGGLDFCQGADWFRCANGRCLGAFFRCDGDNDCGDNSDEQNCPNSTVAKSYVTECKSSEFRCQNDNCIPLDKFCNQVDDCFDGSDEYTGCTTNRTCTTSEFRCANDYCVNQEWICDGQDDCSDNSDEQNCEVHNLANCTHGENLFHCTNGHCIPLNKTCDSNNDCGDGSDEHKTGCAVSKEKCAAELHCSHWCYPTPRGPACSCPPGYSLFNNQTCQDINECLNTQLCDHHCVNENGSYACLCNVGYALQADKRTCKVEEDRGDALLVFSSKTEIRGFYLSKNEVYFPIARNLQHVVGVSLDANYVYWSDIKLGDEAIFRALEDGSKAEVIVTAGLGMPEEIAVDWVTGNIYFTDSVYMRIGVCTNDGAHCTIVVTENTEKPRGLALHPATGEMYWSDWGNKPHISRTEMNGKSSFQLVTEQLAWPNGLTIDYPNTRLYWVDAKLHQVESVNLDGTDRRVVLKTVATHPYAIAVFEDRLFWSDWQTKSIHYCNKFSGKGEKTLLQEVDEIYGIHIYHSVLKPNIHNPCNAKPCDEMCLLAANHSYTCACSLDKVLAEDGRTCRRIRDARHQHLIIAAGGMFIDYFHEILGKPNMTGSYTFHNFAGVAYNPLEDRILVSDTRSNAITTFDPVTAEAQTLFHVNNELIGGMSFDHFGNNLYWSDMIHKTIEIHSLSTSSRALLHFNEEPTTILVIPELAMMYVAFCDISKCHIDKMSMTGNGRTQVVQKNLHGPRVPMAYDGEQKRVYWADQGSGTIESISIDGNDRKYLHYGLMEPVSIAILGDEVFWTLQNAKRLFWSAKRRSIMKNKGLTLLIPLDVDIMHLVTTATPQSSPANLHKCRVNNGGCSHVCLVDTPTLSACRCPPGMMLDKDKKTCVNETACSSDEFRCKADRSCIDKTRLCDGVDDCHNGEDEVNCKYPETCKIGEFRCKLSGECLPTHQVCDGVDHCTDKSDEVNCANHTCDANHFRCRSGHCIPKSWQCDGQFDCADATDEGSDCFTSRTCPKSLYTCQNGRCVDGELLCNAVDDCDDFSDEQYCDEQHYSGRCASTEYRCVYTNKCIPLASRCDGDQDCPKNDDEHHCSHCAGDEFACDNLKCIPRHWMCDEEDDCGDNSDERGCVSPDVILVGRSAYNTQDCAEFKCNGSGMCKPWSYLCDGMSDCYDGSDEGGNCTTACVEDNPCNQLCQRTPQGPLCRCEPGYQLGNDNKTCEDINECERHMCSQLCRNKVGSFECACFEGYTLTSDKTRCKVTEGTMELITATRDDIRRVTAHTPYSLTGMVEVVHRQPHVEITGLDVNVRKSSLYWSSELLGTLHELNTKTNEHKQISNIGRPRTLAVDWVTDNVYLFDSERPPSIKVCTLSEKKCASVVKISGAGSVMSMTVEPKVGYVFWSQTVFPVNTNATSEIWRSDLSGSNATIIVYEKLGLVAGITVDHERGTLYWVDSAEHLIEKSNLDGSNREVFRRENVFQPLGINIYEDSVYWLKGSSGKIYKCGLIGDGHCRPIFVKQTNIEEFFIISHPSRQPAAINNCENHRCDYICVQRGAESTCICSDGLPQTANATCSNDHRPDIKFDSNILSLGQQEALQRVRREAGPFTAILIAVVIGITFLSAYYYYQRHKRDVRAKYNLSIHFENPSFHGRSDVPSNYVLPIIPPPDLEYVNPMSDLPKASHSEPNSDASDGEFVNDDTGYRTRLIKP